MKRDRITRRRSVRPAAFSLVELLVALVVLALGLLGIASVFPVVISQQRQALDDTVGYAQAKQVEAELRSEQGGLLLFPSLLLGDMDFDVPDNSFRGCRGGEVYALPSGLWVTDPGDLPHTSGGSEQAAERGEILLEADQGSRCDGSGFDEYSLDSDDREEVRITPAMRLLPQPYSGDGIEPQFVWDPVFRRGFDGGLEAIVFVRRIDRTIRVPDGQRLSDVLTAGARLPVTPGGRGGDTYSRPRSFAAWVEQPDGTKDTGLDIISITDDPLDGYSRPRDRDSAIYPGQLLVDNLGQVREVIEVLGVQDGDLRVRVNRPVASGETLERREHLAVLDETDQVYTGRYAVLRQVVFTDEEPVSVQVITVGR